MNTARIIYGPTLKSVKVNGIIMWLIKWWLSTSDEHLLLTSRITEEKRTQELQLTSTTSLDEINWNKDIKSLKISVEDN